MEPLFGLSVFYVLLDVLVLWNGKVLALCFGYICFVVVVVVLFFFVFFFAFLCHVSNNITKDKNSVLLSSHLS